MDIAVPKIDPEHLQAISPIPPESPTNQQRPNFPVQPSTQLPSGLSNGVFLHFDKKLADCVKKFPCLYDSKTVGYKDKKTATKIWEMVAKEVEVENGEHAQKLYFNLKKRFHKRRNFLKRLQRSGTTNQILLKKAKSDVNVYAFLDWLIPFTQIRQPRVPIKPEEAGMLEARYGRDDDLDDRPSFIDLHRNYDVSNQNGRHMYVKLENMEEDSNLGDDEEEIVTVRPSSPSLNQSLLRPVTLVTSSDCPSREDVTFNEHQNTLRRGHEGSSSRESIEDRECQRYNENNNAKEFNNSPEDYRNIHKSPIGMNRYAMHSTRHKPFTTHQGHGHLVNENEDHLFGLMVGAELKRFPYRERCIAKLKIQNILFDMQMSMLRKHQDDETEKRESHTV